MDFVPLDPKDLPEPYELDEEKLKNAANEEPFMEASFYLLKEAGNLCTYVANLKPEVPLDRNRAIIVGLSVRLTKLIKLVVRELSGNERYQGLSLARQVVETAATLRYLFEDDGSEERYDKFVNNSLVAEREVLKDIQSNISQGDGEVLDIEKRMQSSIKRTAKAAGIDDVTAIPARRDIGYPSAEKRVKMLGPNAYVAYRTASSETHGDWSDLIRNHLEYEGSTYGPKYDDLHVRPQVPTSLTTVLCGIMSEYLDKMVNTAGIELFKPLLTGVAERTSKLTDLHEKYLEAKGKDD